MCCHRYSAGDQAHVLWGAGVAQPSDAAELVARLNSNELTSRDISGIEAAQVGQWLCDS